MLCKASTIRAKIEYHGIKRWEIGMPFSFPVLMASSFHINAHCGTMSYYIHQIIERILLLLIAISHFTRVF